MLDRVNKLEVEVEEPTEKAADEEEVLAAVRQGLGGCLGLLEAVEQIGNVLSEGANPLARPRLADQVGDQQAEQQFALDCCEVHGRLRRGVQRG